MGEVDRCPNGDGDLVVSWHCPPGEIPGEREMEEGYTVLTCPTCGHREVREMTEEELQYIEDVKKGAF